MMRLLFFLLFAESPQPGDSTATRTIVPGDSEAVSGGGGGFNVTLIAVPLVTVVVIIAIAAAVVVHVVKKRRQKRGGRGGGTGARTSGDYSRGSDSYGYGGSSRVTPTPTQPATSRRESSIYSIYSIYSWTDASEPNVYYE